MHVVPLIELSSGVDALYLSGRADVPSTLLERLEADRSDATSTDCSLPFEFAGAAFQLKPHAFGKYRYCLDHPYGRIGITPSRKLPAIRIQPRAEFLHGNGPRAAVAWFEQVLQRECSPLLLSVSRLDLYADFQGWSLSGNDRHDFLCRATDLATYEADDTFNGIQFGKRGSQAISARLYDKTIESAKTGSAYWKDIWGDQYDPEKSVLRIEFEIGRAALNEFGLSSPDEVLDASGSLWVYLTNSWLTHRVASPDETKSRWPQSRQWESVRRARLGESDFGIERMYAGKRAGLLYNLMPALVGYLSNFGALTDCHNLIELMPRLESQLHHYGRVTGRTMATRISDKRESHGLG